MRLNCLFFLLIISQRSYGIATANINNDMVTHVAQEIENLPIEGIQSSIQDFLDSLDTLCNKFDDLNSILNFARSNFSHIPPTEKPPALNNRPIMIYNRHKPEFELEKKFLMLFNELEWLNQKKKDLGIIEYLDKEIYKSLDEEMKAYESLFSTVHRERLALSNKIIVNATLIDNYIKRIRTSLKNKDISIKKFHEEYPILTAKIKLLNQLLTELNMLLEKPYSSDNLMNQTLIKKSINIQYYSDLKKHITEVLEQFKNHIDHEVQTNHS
jgi:hypothetical protein